MVDISGFSRLGYASLGGSYSTESDSRATIEFSKEYLCTDAQIMSSFIVMFDVRKNWMGCLNTDIWMSNKG